MRLVQRLDGLAIVQPCHLRIAAVDHLGPAAQRVSAFSGVLAPWLDAS